MQFSLELLQHEGCELMQFLLALPRHERHEMMRFLLVLPVQVHHEHEYHELMLLWRTGLPIQGQPELVWVLQELALGLKAFSQQVFLGLALVT